MRTNSTLVVIVRIVAFILLCLYSVLVFGQGNSPSISKTLPLQKFSAVVNEKNVKLHWSLTPGNDVSTVLVEKGYGSEEAFTTLAQYWVNMEGNFSTDFKWSDAIKGKKSVNYRLKITRADGQVVYSDILQFSGQKTGDSLSAIGTTLTGQATSRQAIAGEDNADLANN
jgi:hypothetical protein